MNRACHAPRSVRVNRRLSPGQLVLVFSIYSHRSVRVNQLFEHFFQLVSTQSGRTRVARAVDDGEGNCNMARALGLEPSTRCFGRIAVPCTTRRRCRSTRNESETRRPRFPFGDRGLQAPAPEGGLARGGSGLAVGPTDLDVLAHDDRGESRRSPGGRDVQLGLHVCKLLHPLTPRQELCSKFFARCSPHISVTRPHSSPSSGARTRAFEGGAWAGKGMALGAWTRSQRHSLGVTADRLSAARGAPHALRCRRPATSKSAEAPVPFRGPGLL